MINSFVSKCVDYKFNGAKLKFDLSYALFSSFDIDKGSHFLLKTVARQDVIKNGFSVFDLGCGVGTLGVSVAGSFSDIKLSVMDRDALAVDFTVSNAKKNGLRVFEAFYGLAFDGVLGHYDVVLANIPAKAGESVICSMIKNCGMALGVNGLCCIVVVRTLASFVSSVLMELGCRVVYVEKNIDYTVFHYNMGNLDRLASAEFRLSDYFRVISNFNVRDYSYTLQTVYNLPNFDSVSYDIGLAASVIPDDDFSKAVFVNPNQGHLPLIYLKKFPELKSIFLVSRDALELKISEYNIKRYFSDVEVKVFHSSDFLDLGFNGLSDLFVAASIYKIAEFDYYSFVFEAISSWCGENCKFLLYGKSSNFLKHPKGFKLLKTKKNRGFKAELFRK